MPTPPPSNAKLVHHGHTMDLWQWEQEMFDGTTEIFECVTRQDTVAVIPFLDADTVMLTKQVQPHKGPFMDFPGGRLDHGEACLDAAKRELEEETGYKAERWMEWHHLKNKGKNLFDETLFIASGLHNGAGPHLDAGEKIELVPTPWPQLKDMCLKRQLRQPNIMLAILAMHFDPDARERLEDFLNSR
ncbi:NUDIX hydrolase [Patescibacteria group bacterium]|nr:NUDIX hydrolase [Patescibacteria group bacterium]